MRLSSPLGITNGPRIDPHFGPGDSFALIRDDNAWGYGRNIDWELVVDLPDDSLANWDVSITLWNIRGVDDPYAVTKLVTALGVAAAGGAAGLALGGEQTKNFAAYVAAAAKGLGGEAIKKIISSFFADWPKCTGIVFRKTLTWNRDNFGQSTAVGSLTLESEPIDEVPEGCHQPRYQMDITVTSESMPQFGTSEKLRKRRYHAVQVPARREWIGTWFDSMSSPFTAVTIRPSPQGGPSLYSVEIKEEAHYPNGSRELIIQNTYDPVTELDWRDGFYSGKIIVAKATGMTNATVQTELTEHLLQDNETAALWKGAASVSNLTGSVSDVLLGSSSQHSDIFELVRTGQAKKTFTSETRVNRRVVAEVVFSAVTEGGATLYIEEYGITLRLYTVEDIMESGEVRRWGPILRYYRKPRIEATVADVQLGKYTLLI
ncbi:hypothetical protein [Synechococcus sp. CS-1332]|uniref:hypothetical protein n=1 Tax=Synechococcus sp. CS-1332 TaxID=2847972 RepID=UPI00223C29A8|nr:hypothetical protein [Synechococcus sp. CS-1332]MCT0207734.1 hypothetical protein [Synechococcus sp. CS-1332]